MSADPTESRCTTWHRSFLLLALLSGCAPSVDDYMRSCLAGNNAIYCDLAAGGLRSLHRVDEARRYEAESRRTTVRQCIQRYPVGVNRPYVENECPVQLVWWSDDPAVQAHGIALMTEGCMRMPASADAANAWLIDQVSVSCINLGDATELGRGVDEDPAAAARWYQRGCPVAIPETQRACERRDHPGRALELASAASSANATGIWWNAGAERQARSYTLPVAADRVARARAQLAAGNLRGAFDTVQAIQRLPPAVGTPVDIAPLLAEVIDRRWSAEVDPKVARRHYSSAVALAEDLVRTAPPDAAARQRLAALRRQAAAWHVDAAAHALPRMAALHAALAHLFEPTLPSGTLARARADATGLTFRTAVRGASCEWLTVGPIVAGAAANAGVQVPVNADLRCDATSRSGATSEAYTYPEQLYRTEMQEIPGTTAPDISYDCSSFEPCGQMTTDSRGNSVCVSTRVSRTCSRPGLSTPGRTVSRQVPYTETRTASRDVQTRTLDVHAEGIVVLDLETALQQTFWPSCPVAGCDSQAVAAISGRLRTRIVGTPFHSALRLDEHAWTTPQGSQAFTAAVLGDLERQASAALAAQINSQAVGLIAARAEDAGAVATRRVQEHAPAAEQDEALLTALWHSADVPFAIAWLDERFGLTPVALRELESP